MIWDVIEYQDRSGREMVARVPNDGSGDFTTGSQLVVHEGQAAVFYRDGKALDTFKAGRHTLTTQNIPILSSLISIPFGGKSPFRASVYFVNLKTFADLKWGTKEPIPFRDQELGIVRLRAFGKFAIQIEDPRVFIAELVGTQGTFTTDSIEGYLKDLIVQRLTDLLGESMKTILDLPQHYDEMAVATKARVTESFRKYGLDLKEFVLGAITPPEEVQQAMDKRAKMGVLGDMNRYMQFQAAESISDFAKKPGGVGGIGVDLGMGAGIGAMVGQAFGQQATQSAAAAAAPAAGVACPSCKTSNPPGTKFCGNCGTSMAPKTVPCAACQHPNPATSKFCGNCGQSTKPATVTCPGCKATVTSGKFCPECGQGLG